MTLQRKLKGLGTHYAAVLDQARFHAATPLLRNPAKTVSEIAQLLGYSDVAHFARSFRRIAGVSPLMYRRQAQQDNRHWCG